MKTAVLISGHMRTFPVCVHTLRHHVLRHYRNLTFYVSTVRDEQAETWKQLKTLFPGCPVYADIVPKQPELPELPEPVRFEPYARSVPTQAVLRQLWQLNECWKLYERSGERGHDVFIRARPDLFFHGFRAPSMPGDGVAFVPWWGRFGGINDRFAVMGCDAANAYHTTYSRLAELLEGGCPIHPESLIAESLRATGCYATDTLRATFSTLRVSGEMRPPEISTIDIAEAALR